MRLQPKNQTKATINQLLMPKNLLEIKITKFKIRKSKLNSPSKMRKSKKLKN